MHLMTGQKNLEDKDKDLDMLPKINKLDKADFDPTYALYPQIFSTRQQSPTAYVSACESNYLLVLIILRHF